VADRKHSIRFFAWIQVAVKNPSLGLRYYELDIQSNCHYAFYLSSINLENSFDVFGSIIAYFAGETSLTS